MGVGLPDNRINCGNVLHHALIAHDCVPAGSNPSCGMLSGAFCPSRHSSFGQRPAINLARSYVRLRRGYVTGLLGVAPKSDHARAGVLGLPGTRVISKLRKVKNAKDVEAETDVAVEDVPVKVGTG